MVAKEGLARRKPPDLMSLQELSRDHSWNWALANVNTFTHGLINVYGPYTNK